MKKLMTFLDLIFGCHHNQLSRVFTIEGRTYRVCCRCGAKFGYSLASMAIERGSLPATCAATLAVSQPLRDPLPATQTVEV